MPSYRIFYPLNYVALGNEAVPSGAIPIHGLQSVSMNTSFSLEQVFELGQLDIYENVENLPTIEMNLSKVLDGYPLIYHLSTPNSVGKALSVRSNQRCSAVLSIFSDAQDNSSGVPSVQAYCSGLYINSLQYNLPVQGPCTETVTLVGNDKIWKSSAFYFNGHFTGNDSPASGVQRRQMVIMGAAPTGSVFPSVIPGLTVVNGSGYNLEVAGQFGAHVQDVSISTNLNREDLFELGHRRPYYKYATFPTAVTASINVTPAGNGDNVNADSNSASNLSNEPIWIKLQDGTRFNLGTKNKLQSVTYGGADAGGGLAQVSYNFQNFNFLEVTDLSDPSAQY